MSDKDYEALRDFLHQFPRGFLKTESGVEIKILKRLFTEDEARLAIKLSTLPEEITKIAERLDLKADDLEKKLDALAKKGLAFRFRRGGVPFYRAAPFMIGLYEYSVKKIDRELAALFKEYYEAAYIKELGNHDIPGFKVIPMEKNIDVQKVLLPYQRLEESVRAARKISVTDCVCRKEADLLGEGCHHPLETCLSFGVAAEYYIDSGLGREIKADEAIRILEEADQSGLVHAGANSMHLSNICNCCPCCCAALKAITNWGSYRQRHFNAVYEAVVDEKECTACEACLDRCPVGAIQVEEKASVDRDKCLGCGLCATTCPMESITLILRPDRQEPFDNVGELGSRVLEAKGKAPLMIRMKND
ncbi:MAG: 4Fe-4S binding protein [Thermodesulfobacteriota bacterium]|jgi:NAD-dependent dihydropyrimidine dehydrogenase PreA subunit